jgi:hypothetical protein
MPASAANNAGWVPVVTPIQRLADRYNQSVRGSRLPASSSLFAALATSLNRQRGSTRTVYDSGSDMTRLVKPDGRLAIDVRGLFLSTKKKDVEKGEDQKDKW